MNQGHNISVEVRSNRTLFTFGDVQNFQQDFIIIDGRRIVKFKGETDCGEAELRQMELLLK